MLVEIGALAHPLPEANIRVGDIIVAREPRYVIGRREATLLYWLYIDTSVPIELLRNYNVDTLEQDCFVDELHLGLTAGDFDGLRSCDRPHQPFVNVGRSGRIAPRHAPFSSNAILRSRRGIIHGVV